MVYLLETEFKLLAVFLLILFFWGLSYGQRLWFLVLFNKHSVKFGGVQVFNFVGQMGQHKTISNELKYLII
jgi:hypothetical protein